MTISKLSVDGSTATYCAEFNKGEMWADACDEAAKWVQEIRTKHFPNTSLYFIHIDSYARPDNRVKRYYGVFKRKAFSIWVDSNCPPIIDDSLTKGGDTLYFGAIEINSDSLPNAIDFCRVNRNTYLVLSSSPKKVETLTKWLANLRLDGASVRVDDLATMELFLKARLAPIRIWESHHDFSIFVEVYTS